MRDALHWVSRSMTSTRRLDQEAAAWASMTAMVDLPTPPFLFDTAKNCVIHHPLWKHAWVEGVMRFVGRAQHQSLHAIFLVETVPKRCSRSTRSAQQLAL